MKYTLKKAFLLCTLVFQASSLYSAAAGAGAEEPTEDQLKEFFTAAKSGDVVTVKRMMGLYPEIVDETHEDDTLFRKILLLSGTPDAIIYAIIKAGYNVNTVDTPDNGLTRGFTALSQAAARGEVVMLFLKCIS